MLNISQLFAQLLTLSFFAWGLIFYTNHLGKVDVMGLASLDPQTVQYSAGDNYMQAISALRNKDIKDVTLIRDASVTAGEFSYHYHWAKFILYDKNIVAYSEINQAILFKKNNIVSKLPPPPDLPYDKKILNNKNGDKVYLWTKRE